MKRLIFRNSIIHSMTDHGKFGRTDDMKRKLFIACLTAALLLLCCLAAALADEAYWAGSGTAADPWRIASAVDLIALREYLAQIDDGAYGKYFLQTADISLSAHCGEGKGDFAPLGAQWAHLFKGTYNGGGHSITDLYISNGGNYTGLFGIIESQGTVRNLSVTGYVHGANGVGGIAGFCAGSIIDCSFTGSVSGDDDVGGIAGSIQTTARGLYASGSVSGREKVGGISGYTIGNASDCHFTGTVRGTKKWTGGVFGYFGLSGSVSDCEANADVSGNYICGGIVGGLWSPMSNCVMRGTVHGWRAIGGIVGEMGRPISNCTNYATVTSTGPDAGGISGYTSRYNITNCINYGDVSSIDSWVGGIVGTVVRGYSVSESVNYGNVSGVSCVGGIVGETNGDVTDCENHGTVTGGADTGSIVGSGPVSGVIVMDSNGMTDFEQTLVLHGKPMLAPECPFENAELLCDDYGWLYQFFAWNTAADGSGDWYKTGDVIELPNDTRLYAIWMTGRDQHYYDPVTDDLYYTEKAWFLRDYCPVNLPENVYIVSNWAGLETELTKRFTFNGNTKLVLTSNAVMRATKGFHVPAGSSLTVYTSSLNGSASNATLTIASPPANCAAIGGNNGESGGTITIYDGIFSITAGDYATGIGGGKKGGAGNVTIGGGRLTIETASNNYSTAIGTGAEFTGTNGGTVTVNGGMITAYGSFGAAIGSGDISNGIDVVINDGYVMALSFNGGAGIGTGPYGSGGSVTVNGGTVHAYGGSYNGGRSGAGIGAGRARNNATSGNSGNITINGGTVYARGGENAQAIGVSNEIAGHDSGTLTLHQRVAVYIGDSTSPVDWDERVAAARSYSVKLGPHNSHTPFLSDDITIRCTQCGERISGYNFGTGLPNSPYRVGATTNKTQVSWDEWVNVVGNLLPDCHFVMTEDITTSAMMGSGSVFSSHTFDGAGHTLTFNCDTDENGAAPFSVISKATIKNLRVNGTITTSGSGASGLVGKAFHACTIENCVSDVDIVSTGSGGNHAGFVSAFGYEGRVTVRGCAFTGSITGVGAHDCSGFISSANENSAVINCLYDGEISAGNGATAFMQGGADPLNCYYTNAYGLGGADGKLLRSVSADIGVTVGFGTPAATYALSGITAYDAGIMLNGVFHAGEGDTVSLYPSADPWEGYNQTFTADNGTLTQTNDGWKLTVPSADVLISVLRTPAFATSPAVTLTFDGGTDGVRSDQYPDKLFDGLDGTKWCCAFDGTNWVEFRTDVPVSPTAYAFTTGGDTQRYPGRNPVSWRLLGKLGAADDWTELTVQTDSDHMPPENCAEIFFPLSASGSWRYYRLEISAIASGSVLQLSEFRLIGVPVFGSPDFILPSQLSEIEQSAFEGLTTMSAVDAKNCVSIGSRAFKGSGLTRIKLPKDCSIDDDAFEDCGKVYVFAPAGGSTEAYCAGKTGMVFVAEEQN